MDLTNLEKALAEEPKYRLKQAKEAVFQKFISDWQEATFFSLELRQKLNKECQLQIKSEMLTSKTKDSIKARITLKDDLQVETVLMRHNDGRNTVCVSSQIGCPLDCGFCATGQMGFKRNLEYFEIVEQVILFARYLKEKKQRVTNVVFMGMGEPFLNYDNVMKAIRILNEADGLGIGARNISISTVGITGGIQKLSRENLQVNLAVSLHAPNNKLRSKIIPTNKEYPIEAILKAVDEYIKKTKRKVMFEYILIKGVNDSDACATELGRLMKK
ncbi:MAG: 23S rRNA (adenine(2503)-C(2))-methyltransferase RlmN, partial [Candidatus Nealsonbacteria bacterium]